MQLVCALDQIQLKSLNHKRCLSPELPKSMISSYSSRCFKMTVDLAFLQFTITVAIDVQTNNVPVWAFMSLNYAKHSTFKL